MISISKAGHKDWKIIQELGCATFVETFAASNTEANMNAYLRQSFTDEKIQAELNNPDSLFFIAWNGETPIGYLKLNTGKAQTEPQDDTCLEIERIYVLAAYQGKKNRAIALRKSRRTGAIITQIQHLAGRMGT